MYSYSSVVVHSSIRVDVYVCVPVLSYIRMLEGSCINIYAIELHCISRL